MFTTYKKGLDPNRKGIHLWIHMNNYFTQYKIEVRGMIFKWTYLSGFDGDLECSFSKNNVHRKFVEVSRNQQRY